MTGASDPPMFVPADDRKDAPKSKRSSVLMLLALAATAFSLWLLYQPTGAVTAGPSSLLQPTSNGESSSLETKGVDEMGATVLEAPSQPASLQKPQVARPLEEVKPGTEVQSNGSTTGFVVYVPFPEPQTCQRDAHFNPERRVLSTHDLEALQTLIAAANEVLTEKQTELRLKTEEWAKVLIESGLADPDSSVRKLELAAGSSRVAVFQGGQFHTATVRPGDNAILDQLSTDLASFVTETHGQIRDFFH